MPSHQVSTCTAKGSFSSNRSMSSIAEPRLLERPRRRRDGPDAHEVRLDSRVRERDEPHRRLEAELVCGSSFARRAAVAPSVSPAEFPAVTRPPARNGVRSRASPSCVVSGRRNWSRSASVQPSSVNTLIGTTVRAITPSGSSQRGRRPRLRAYRERVGVVLRQVREDVVEVLGRLPHHRRALVDQPLADEPRVEVDLLAHGVVPHVLDAARRSRRRPRPSRSRLHRPWSRSALLRTCGRR